jgi:hypothetical protein
MVIIRPLPGSAEMAGMLGERPGTDLHIPLVGGMIGSYVGCLYR